MADKAYDIDSFHQALTEGGIKAVIPSKKNRLKPAAHDRHLYKERNIVERFFQKIKRFRRIATRYDKTARNVPHWRTVCEYTIDFKVEQS